MILPDINILIYAYNKAAKQHRKCAVWLEATLNADETICFSWHTIMGFVRIVTTPNMFPNHFTPAAALDIASSMMTAQNAKMLQPGIRHFAILRKLIEQTGISGARISDAHIAALAIEHGATIASADRDFRVFDGIDLINPAAENN